MPGISGHDILLLAVSSWVVLNKKSPNKVFQYHNADFDGIVTTIAQFGSSFNKKYASNKDLDVEEMWESFKQALLSSQVISPGLITSTKLVTKQTSSLHFSAEILESIQHMLVPGAASLESKTNYALQNTTWASSCPLTSHCDTGSEAETWIATRISNKLLQDRLIQKQLFPTCNQSVEHTPTIHRF